MTIASDAENLVKTSNMETWAAMSDDVLVKQVQCYRSYIEQIMPTSSNKENYETLFPVPALPGAASASTINASQSLQFNHGHKSSNELSSTVPEPIPTTARDESTEDQDKDAVSICHIDPSEWQVPPHCIPIHANVTTYDWKQLYESAQFDVVMMDPPWQLATSNPTRGVSLGYSQLTDHDIANLPVPMLQQRGGFLFVWVINAKYKWTLDLFETWGYDIVDEIVWVKMTVNRRMAKSHGYYLQHAKEVCLVGKKGADPPGMQSGGVCSDVIFSERRGQSQKPEEIYQLIEELVPNGRYLEVFARKNNLRNYWVSVGNEVTGTGLPEEDMDALRERATIPNAVYGRATTSRAN